MNQRSRKQARMAAILFIVITSALAYEGHSQGNDELNFDEDKIPAYTLPDPLKTADGKVNQPREPSLVHRKI